MKHYLQNVEFVLFLVLKKVFFVFVTVFAVESRKKVLMEHVWKGGKYKGMHRNRDRVYPQSSIGSNPTISAWFEKLQQFAAVTLKI